MADVAERSYDLCIGGEFEVQRPEFETLKHFAPGIRKKRGGSCTAAFNTKADKSFSLKKAHTHRWEGYQTQPSCGK
jgi:hypothetical protein